MAHIVRFQDGILVEIAQNPDRAVPVAGKTAERVTQAFQSAADVVGGALRSVVTATRQAVRDAAVAEAELEFGIGFSIEGNVYLTKATGEGNINIKVKIVGTQS